jgi:hypothetical protein
LREPQFGSYQGGKGFSMIRTDDDRLWMMNAWNAFCVTAAIWYLSGSLLKAVAVGIFLLVSGLLNYGSRWLSRVGFAIAIVALAVLLGAPGPDQWRDLVQGMPQAIANTMPSRG